MSNEVEQRVLTMTDKRNLEKELEELRQAKLDVAEEIKIARGHGDLSENAEYDEAKNNEARIYGRLAEVENSVYRLADSIKKTQKRANALKNIMIPRFEETVKFITNALDEKDREEFSRLKVIKRQKSSKAG